MITLLAQFDLSQKYFCIDPGISLSLLIHSNSFACTSKKEISSSMSCTNIFINYFIEAYIIYSEKHKIHRCSA